MHLATFAKILTALLCCFSYPTKTWSAVIEPADYESYDDESLSTTSSSFETDSIGEHDEPEKNDDPFSHCLFHEETQKYYPTYTLDELAIKGPCGKFMRLYKESNHSYNGVCLCKKPTDSCPGRPLLYWSATKRCHYAYEQGPCDNGEWLISNKKGEAHCQRNPCPSTESSMDQYFNFHLYDFYFRHNNVCYRTNTTAFCEDDKKVFVLQTAPGPTCLRQTPLCEVFPFSLPYSARLQCPPRTKLEKDGSCAKIVTFSK